MKYLIRIGWILALMAALCLTSCLNEVSDSNLSTGKLPENVATVSDQVASMKTSLAEMKAIVPALEGIVDLKEGVILFNACVTSLSEHISAVEAGMADVDATVAAIELQGRIAEVVGGLKIQSVFYENTAVMSGILSFEKGVASWLGKHLNKYFVIASYHASLDAMVKAADAQVQLVDAIASDVEAGLLVGDSSDLGAVLSSVTANTNDMSELLALTTELCNEVKEGYLEAIKSPTHATTATLKTLNDKVNASTDQSENTLANLYKRLQECEAAITEINARLERIETDVADLLNMIQSLTFISEYSTDKAHAYYSMDVNSFVSGSNLPYCGKAQRTAAGNVELSYMVRPASAAKALNANAVGVIGYYAKPIVTKAIDPSVYIDFEVADVAVTNGERGVIKVTVKPAFKEEFYYKEVGAKCALNVTSGKTDITSSFVEILPVDISSTVYVTGISVSEKSIEIDKGGSYTLNATVTPSNATDGSCRWTSSNNDVVTIDSSTGRVEAVGVGEAVVTVTSNGVDEWGLPHTAECRVRVNEAFRLSGPSYVEMGSECNLVLNYPASVGVNSIDWKSSDESKAVVDGNGKVTGVAHTYQSGDKSYGLVTISCTINNAIILSHDIMVVVVQPKSINTPGLPEGKDELTMRVDESVSLASTIYPANVPDGAYRIRYQSNLERFINYDTGVINEYKNTLSPTTAYVDITVDNSDQDKYLVVGALKKTVIVKVLPYYVKTISFDPVEMQLGQTVTLSPRFTSDVDGKTPTNTAVIWKSSNEAIATVDANGMVTSKSEGTVDITATATDGSNVCGTCSVTVTQPWKSFVAGDYVVRTPSGDIEFASDIDAAKGMGEVVGVVVAKTNPRASDPLLPSTCTHGVAIALGEGEGKWWSAAPSSSPYKVYEWATQNGYQSIMGVDWSSSKGTHRAGTAEMFVGYNNTLALKAFLESRGITSEMLSALNAYKGPALPSGASSYYLPSVAEMDAIAAVSAMSWALSNKLESAGGAKFTNAPYWTVSESGNSSSNAAKVNPLTGALDGAGMKTNAAKFRYVFAF